MIFPGRGVYVARIGLSGDWYRAAVNVGHNPTFLRKGDEEAFVRIEAFLLGFSGDAYGATLTVDFLAKLRDEEKFPSPAALVERMHDDIARPPRSATRPCSSWACESARPARPPLTRAPAPHGERVAPARPGGLLVCRYPFVWYPTGRPSLGSGPPTRYWVSGSSRKGGDSSGNHKRRQASDHLAVL